MTTKIFLMLFAAFWTQLLLVELLAAAESHEQQKQCPEGSFLCSLENACIPMEWVGDGEPDCQDGADESNNQRHRNSSATTSGFGRGGGDVAAIAGGKGIPPRPQTSSLAGVNKSSLSESKTTLPASILNDLKASAAHQQQHPNEDEESEGPFEEQQVLDSETGAMTTVEDAAAGSEECQPEAIKTVRDCSVGLVGWQKELAATVAEARDAPRGDPSQTVFGNEKIMSSIRRGCDLLSVYAACAEGAPASCDNELSRELRDWISVQIFACELLVPSVGEHAKCYAVPRGKTAGKSAGTGACSGAKILVPSDAALSSASICSLLALIRSDIVCVQSTPGRPECTETSMEMIHPLLTETDHTFAELNCSSSVLVVNDDGGEQQQPNNNNKSSSPLTKNQGEKENELSTKSVQQQTSSSSAEKHRQKSSSITTTPTSTTTSTQTTRKSPASSESVATTASHHQTQPSAISEETASVEITRQPPAQDRQRVKPVIGVGGVDPKDLSSAWSAMANIELVCTSELMANIQNDLFAPIRSKICYPAARETFANEAIAECLKQVAQTAVDRCTVKPQKKSSCAVIDAFSQNIECGLPALEHVCPSDAKELIAEINEQLKDEAIAHRCYEQLQNVPPGVGRAPPGGSNQVTFTLRPNNSRCTSDQENAAMLCLVELSEISGHFQRFRSANFLLEAGEKNSSLLRVCEVYQRYETCLATNVFSKSLTSAGARCAFNSPLNTLARIGLSPMCKPQSLDLFRRHRECLMDLGRPAASQNGGGGSPMCQSSLIAIGQAVNFMLQGVHGEAHLCKAFYMIEDTFECGKVVAEQKCPPEVADEIESLQKETFALGLEEGCPRDEPPELNIVLAQNPRSAGESGGRSSSSLTPPPIAHTMISETSSASAEASSTSVCEENEHARFDECVHPLTKFQPHPIAVIKHPKDIEKACEAYRRFTQCRASVPKCYPLWARGMSAMFDFACGVGNEKYLKVRQCVRRLTTRSTIRECVLNFSKAAPQDACPSSNGLLQCALPPVAEKCGGEAADFILEYLSRFTMAVDPNCTLTSHADTSSPPNVLALNCTLDESKLVQQCAKPLRELHRQLDAMFHGGFQAFLKNVHGLSGVFAQGCSLSSSFRECVKPVVEEQKGQCVVSSCIIQAGAGICDQPDVAAAIDSNLGCVFKQVSDPEFGKCLRSTIGALRQFNLEALREILPNFVACVEPVVMRNCGQIPLNVLRVLGSRDVCALKPSKEQSQTPAAAAASPTCSVEKRTAREQCRADFSYVFRPVVLVAAGKNASSISAFSSPAVNQAQLCKDLQTLVACQQSVFPCDLADLSTRKGRFEHGLQALASRICSPTGQVLFAQNQACILAALSSDEGRKCIVTGAAGEFSSVDGATGSPPNCSALNQTMNCAAQQIHAKCGLDAVQFVFDASNEYLRALTSVEEQPCQLEAPTVSLLTGCPEQEFVAFLECEAKLDKFRPRPITFIGNASDWDEFCHVANDDYRNCVEKLSCRIEPAATASQSLYANLCEREITRRDQRRFASCLERFAESPQGQHCLAPFKTVDLLSGDAGRMVCQSVDKLLLCSAREINATCGEEALLHVYDVHNIWTSAFNASCVLTPPDLTPLPVSISTLQTTTSVSTFAPGVIIEETSSTASTTKPTPTSSSPSPTTTTSATTKTQKTTTTTEATEKSTTTTTSKAPTPTTTTTTTTRVVPTARGTTTTARTETTTTKGNGSASLFAVSQLVLLLAAFSLFAATRIV